MEGFSEVTWVGCYYTLYANKNRLSGDFELQRQETFGASAANGVRRSQELCGQLFRSRSG
jgi:hypothetical protein